MRGFEGTRARGARPTRSWPLGPALAASVLAVSALLGGAVSAPASAAGARGAPMKIGLVCSCSGPLASSYRVGPPAYEAWAKSVNARGGINGHRVQVIVKDDGSSPGTSLAEVESLVNDDHVLALVDSTNNDVAWGDYARDHDVPVIGGGAVTILDLTNPDFFAAGQTEDDFIVAQVEAAKKVGATTIGELYCSEAATCQELVPPLRATAKALGVKIGYLAQISAGAPNYTAQCLAAKNAGVQALSIGEAVDTVEAVARDCARQGYTPYELVGNGGVATSFTTSPGLGDRSIGFETDIPFFVDSTPGTRAMNRALERYAPAILTSPEYNEIATISWISGLLFGAAAKAGGAGLHGPATTTQIYDGLYKLRDDTLGGMAPPLTFRRGVPNPVDCWFWIAIRHGKFTTPYGLKPHCEKPPPGTL